MQVANKLLFLDLRLQTSRGLKFCQTNEFHHNITNVNREKTASIFTACSGGRASIYCKCYVYPDILIHLLFEMLLLDPCCEFFLGNFEWTTRLAASYTRIYDPSYSILCTVSQGCTFTKAKLEPSNTRPPSQDNSLNALAGLLTVFPGLLNRHQSPFLSQNFKICFVSTIEKTQTSSTSSWYPSIFITQQKRRAAFVKAPISVCSPALQQVVVLGGPRASKAFFYAHGQEEIWTHPWHQKCFAGDLRLDVFKIQNPRDLSKLQDIIGFSKFLWTVWILLRGLWIVEPHDAALSCKLGTFIVSV